MKPLCLMVAILFVLPAKAHDELFPSCPSKHPEHKIEDKPKPFALYKVAPVYPNRELARGISGAVILEFTVTKEGETSDIKVLSTSSNAFSREAIKALKAFKYEPALVDGEAVAISGQKHKITFEIEDSETGLFMESETLDFDPVALSKTIKSASSRNPKKALEKISKALEKETNGFHKAVLYYVKSSTEYEANPDDISQQEKSLLLSLDELSTLNQNELNVINLRSMAIAALSRMFVLQEKYQETIDFLRPFLKDAWDRNFFRPNVIYDATVNFSIAAYNASEFCYAYHGFNRAIQQGSIVGANNPNWIKYRDAAKKYMND